MERRILLAAVMSILVIMTFQYWLAKNYPQKRTAGPYETTPATPQQPQESFETLAAPLPNKEEEYVVETDRFILTFSNTGGAIKKIELKEFKEAQTSAPFELAKIKDPRFYIGVYNLVEYRLPDYAVYKMDRGKDKISFTYTAPDNIEIEKTYTVRNHNDYIELYIRVKNITAGEIKTSPQINIGSSINISGDAAQRYHYASGKVDGNIVWAKQDSSKTGDVSWGLLANDSFCILMRPHQTARRLQTNLIEKGNLSCSIESAFLTIPPASEIVQQYLYYIGPFDASRVKSLGMGLEEAINYGKLNGFVRVLLSLLNILHKAVRNWGVAIIFLTILVNIVLSPLSIKSYKSMKVMQELQPQIDKLRTLHKNNPQKLNRELIELYREYKVNPFGGCLPLFIQMPIFLALYHVLIRSVELKSAQFLWIKDLSRPDALSLPFSPPILGRTINILPILTTIVMYLQQRLSTGHKLQSSSEQQKQQQAMMTIIIPAMMLIFFYNMSSGFVLYFLVNTLLMTITQYRIKTSLPSP